MIRSDHSGRSLPGQSPARIVESLPAIALSWAPARIAPAAHGGGGRAGNHGTGYAGAEMCAWL
ncbi:MAG TPA: hypothetical protein PLC79_07490, partial [Phycisphaerae bacterium]|nr:hypothetical protein [Phycisphaerae bacterium]